MAYDTARCCANSPWHVGSIPETAAPSTETTSDPFARPNDANFNVTALVNPSGVVVERYAYSPYGKPTVLDADFTLDANNLSDFANTTLFAGRELDPESGLYYYRARYYSAELGRFVGRDPLKADENLYCYCGDSPLDAVDPTGKIVREESPHTGPGKDGNFDYRWSFRLSIAPTEDVTVVQGVRVSFLNWRYVDSNKPVGRIGPITYFEVVGTVQANTTPPVVRFNNQNTVDAWNFGSTGMVNGRRVCGTVHMEGQVRAFRAQEIAEVIQNWESRRQYYSSGAVRIPWTAGVLPSSRTFADFNSATRIVEREELLNVANFTWLNAEWDGRGTNTSVDGPHRDVASKSRYFK